MVVCREELGERVEMSDDKIKHKFNNQPVLDLGKVGSDLNDESLERHETCKEKRGKAQKKDGNNGQVFPNDKQQIRSRKRYINIGRPNRWVLNKRNHCGCLLLATTTRFPLVGRCRVRSCPTFARGAPIKRVCIRFLHRRCAGGRRNTSPTWLARVAIVETIVRARIALSAGIGTLLLSIRTLSSPVSRLSTLVTVSRLLRRIRSVEAGLVLHEVQNLGTCNASVCIGCDISKGSRGRFGIANVSGRGPFLAIEESPVGVFGFSTNVLVGELLLIHVLVGSGLFLETDVQKSLLKTLLRSTEWEAEVFIS